MGMWCVSCDAYGNGDEALRPVPTRILGWERSGTLTEVMLHSPPPPPSLYNPDCCGTHLVYELGSAASVLGLIKGMYRHMQPEEEEERSAVGCVWARPQLLEHQDSWRRAVLLPPMVTRAPAQRCASYEKVVVKLGLV